MKIKKNISVLLIAMFMLALFPAHALADELGCSGGENHSHEGFGTASGEIWWEKEVTVYLENDEDFWTYPRNPKYKYTFIWMEPITTRAVCTVCGSPNMSIANEYVNTDVILKKCPHNDAALTPDEYSEHRRYNWESCSSCGYKSERWATNIYRRRAVCAFGEKPYYGGDWIVEAHRTQANGYDLHESLNYWLYDSYQ